MQFSNKHKIVFDTVYLWIPIPISSHSNLKAWVAKVPMYLKNMFILLQFVTVPHDVFRAFLQKRLAIDWTLPLLIINEQLFSFSAIFISVIFVQFIRTNWHETLAIIYFTEVRLAYFGGGTLWAKYLLGFIHLKTRMPTRCHTDTHCCKAHLSEKSSLCVLFIR